MEGANNQEIETAKIMTLHAAKGLEFPLVFLPGWEEGLFPNQRSIDENGESGLEEERRLAYVGITRAKSDLWIFNANSRLTSNPFTTDISMNLMHFSNATTAS